MAKSVCFNRFKFSQAIIDKLLEAWSRQYTISFSQTFKNIVDSGRNFSSIILEIFIQLPAVFTKFISYVLKINRKLNKSQDLNICTTVSEIIA